MIFFLPVLIFRFQIFFFLKHCGNNNKDEDNSLKNLNDKNQQVLSQKFRQLEFFYLIFSLHKIFKSDTWPLLIENLTR